MAVPIDLDDRRLGRSTQTIQPQVRALSTTCLLTLLTVSELPEKVQQLDKQYQQLREEFTRSRNKAGAKVTAVW